MRTITRQEIEDIKKSGRIVIEYPRKNIVLIDGYKKYKLKKTL